MLNNLAIIGRPTGDPELKETSGGVSICTFSLACDRDYKGDDGTYPTDFFRCVAYRNTAERCAKLVHKGVLINLVGRIQQNTYEKDGQRRSIVEIKVDNLYLITPKERGEEPAPDDIF